MGLNTFKLTIAGILIIMGSSAFAHSDREYIEAHTVTYDNLKNPHQHKKDAHYYSHSHGAGGHHVHHGDNGYYYRHPIDAYSYSPPFSFSKSH